LHRELVKKMVRKHNYQGRTIGLNAEYKKFVMNESNRLNVTYTSYIRALVEKYRHLFENGPHRIPAFLSVTLKPEDMKTPPCFMSFSQYISKIIELEMGGSFNRIESIMDGVSLEDAYKKLQMAFRKQICSIRVLRGFKLRFEFNHRIYELRKDKFVCVDSVGEPEAQILGFQIEMDVDSE